MIEIIYDADEAIKMMNTICHKRRHQIGDKITELYIRYWIA